MQQLGETVTAIIDDDNRLLNELLNQNRERTALYWIVIAAKPSKVRDRLGRACIMRHFKAHYTKPHPMVGAIIAEVDNSKGTINWDISPHDVPFGYGALGLKEDGASKATTSIPQAYRYN